MISTFVLIIGAMKSGTTTLYDYLTKHPQIAGVRYKEPSFFAFEEKWALSFDWYESQFDYDPNRHLYALDASTDYSKYPFCKDVVERLKASAPRRFKLIYIMRHPLRRIESHAWHAAHTRCEIGQYPSPRPSHSFDAGISPVSLAITRYAYQIDRFSEFYDKGELLLLTLEQLARQPNAVLEKVCKFLEIDPLINTETSLKSNTAESRSSPSSTWRSYPLLQKLQGGSALQRVAKIVVPKAIRSQIYRVVRTSAPPEGRFRLNDEEAQNTIAALVPDLRRLRDRYRVDVEKEWGITL